jgi:polyhydroxyalkanoate synthase
LLLQQYLAGAQLLYDLVHVPGQAAKAEAKAELYRQILTAAVSPTNFVPTNPAALKRAFVTAGGSIVAGMRNFVDDWAHNGGLPRQVGTSSFRLGANLAATPGSVVFRNELMELIQYAPQTNEVYEHPLLVSPPWTNKYHIMDLAPGRSSVEWAVRHGHTTFATSYRNPAINDHIVPWRSAYKANGLMGGEVRFVLSGGGHIAGIVNPPGPKGWFLANGSCHGLSR